MVSDSNALQDIAGEYGSEEELNLPSSGDDPDVDFGGDAKHPCSPSWASLDAHNLCAHSMTSKSKFNEDALHDDRVRVHQGINRSVQLCITDSQGRLMAIPSEDGIEICLPGIALELGHSMDLLPYGLTSVDVAGANRVIIENF